jgi:hypothetical protein
MKAGRDVVPCRNGPVIEMVNPFGSENARFDTLFVERTGTEMFATVTV